MDELLAPVGGEDASGAAADAAFDKPPDAIDGKTLFVKESYAKVRRIPNVYTTPMHAAVSLVRFSVMLGVTGARK